MRGVRDEPALASGGLLDARQHRIHGARKPVDLVTAAGLGDTAVQVPVADRCHLGADTLDGAQRPTGDRRGGARDEQQQYRHADQQQFHKRLRALFYGCQAGRRVDHEAPGRE